MKYGRWTGRGRLAPGVVRRIRGGRRSRTVYPQTDHCRQKPRSWNRQAAPRTDGFEGTAAHGPAPAHDLPIDCSPHPIRRHRHPRPSGTASFGARSCRTITRPYGTAQVPLAVDAKITETDRDEVFAKRISRSSIVTPKGDRADIGWPGYKTVLPLIENMPTPTMGFRGCRLVPYLPFSTDTSPASATSPLLRHQSQVP